MDRVPIDITHDCPPCYAAAGPCEVDIFDDVIRVRPTTLDAACDITCPPVCNERVDTCLTPQLPEGTWRGGPDEEDHSKSLTLFGFFCRVART